MKQSQKFQLNKTDLIIWSKDALKVLAPYVIVIIPVLLKQIPEDWGYAAVTVFILQRVRAALELYLAGK